MKKKIKGIYVEWLDATTKSGWHETSDCGLLKCHTLGFLMDETDDFITVAATHVPDDSGMISSNTIPKVWITKRKRIKY